MVSCVYYSKRSRYGLSLPIIIKSIHDVAQQNPINIFQFHYRPIIYQIIPRIISSTIAVELNRVEARNTVFYKSLLMDLGELPR